MRERCRSPHAIYIIHSFSSVFQEKRKEKTKKFDSVARTHLKKQTPPIRNHDLLRIRPSNHHSENSIPFLCGGRMSAVPHHFPDFLIYLHQFFLFFARNAKKSSRFQRTDQTFKNKVSECFSSHYGNKPLMTSASISRCNATTYAPIRSVQCFS